MPKKKQKNKKSHKKPGRPSKYSDNLARKICEKIATSSKGLHNICRENDTFPSVTTIMSWLFDGKHKEFVELYNRSREEQAEYLAEEILEIADDSSKDTKVITKGDTAIEIENTEWTNRSKLRVDSRKWIAAHLKPKKYGDKIDVQHSGTIGTSTKVKLPDGSIIEI